MTTLSEDVANHAPGHKLAGVEFYHFGWPELAEFERRRYEAERDRLRLLRDDYGPDAFAARLDELRARYERHEFAFANDEEFRKSPEGILLILQVMTKRPLADVWQLLIDHPQEAAQMMSLVITESFPKLRPAGSGAATPAAS